MNYLCEAYLEGRQLGKHYARKSAPHQRSVSITRIWLHLWELLLEYVTTIRYHSSYQRKERRVRETGVQRELESRGCHAYYVRLCQ